MCPILCRQQRTPIAELGTYCRSLLVGYFEGIGSERGIAWRLADSLGLRQFLQIGLDEKTPDYSTISRTRRLIDVETHRKVFGWVLGLLADRGLLKGKMVGVDATTLQANAAMRSIVWRDNGQHYEAFLTELANKSGIATPSREDSARLDRKRKKKGSNQEWRSATDPDARIAKMKDGSAHMAHKAEHAVDMESAAVIAFTVQAADQGDTTTIHETLAEAGEAVAELIQREAEKAPEAKPQVSCQRNHGDSHGQGLPHRQDGGGVGRVRGVELHPGTTTWAAAMGRQSGGTEVDLRQPPAGKGQRWKAITKETSRTDRTLICALLGNRWDEANTSERAREHPEATVDSCLRVQLKPDIPADTGCGHTTGTEKPASGAHFGVNAVAVCAPGAGRRGRKRSSQPDAFNRHKRR
jgi:hypothetical protein